MFTSQTILDAISTRLKGSITILDALPIEEFIRFAERFQLEIVQLFGLTDIKVRRLDPVMIETLLETVTRGKGGQFAFRHGEQDPGPVVAAYDEAYKKIVMMQAEHNESDPITHASAIEFIGTLLTIAYLQQKTKYTVTVESSANLRARQPAETLVRTLETSFALPSALACINYPEDDLLDCAQLDAKGNLEWNPTKVDAVVGAGSFEKITTSVREILAEPIGGPVIKVIMTHTQQLDVFYADASGKPATGRLSNYGFILRTPEGVLRCENGFYSSEKLTLESAATPAPTYSLPLSDSMMAAASPTDVKLSFL